MRYIGNPHAGQYHDPITVAILSLPWLSFEKKQLIVGKWCDIRPTRHIDRFLEWYGEYDSKVILVLRILVTLAPILLARQDIPIEWILASVTFGILAIEYLDRIRSEKAQEKKRNETLKEWYNQVEKPREKARRREMFDESSL